MTTGFPGDGWPMPYMSAFLFWSDFIIKIKDSGHYDKAFWWMVCLRGELYRRCNLCDVDVVSSVFLRNVPNCVPSHFVKLSISISGINCRGLLLILNIGIVYSERCPFRRALSFLPYACAHFSVSELRWPDSGIWVSGFTWWGHCIRNFFCLFRWRRLPVVFVFPFLILFRHFRTYALLHVPQVPAQVGIEYACSQLCMYIQGSPVEIQTPTHRNLIGRTTTAPPVMLSPSIMLPSPSPTWAFFPARKIPRELQKILLFF